MQEAVTNRASAADGETERSARTPDAAGGCRSERVVRDVVALVEGLLVAVCGLVATRVCATWLAGVPDWIVVAQGSIVVAALFNVFMRHAGQYTLAAMTGGVHRVWRTGSLLVGSMFCVIGLGSPFASTDVRMVAWYGVWSCLAIASIVVARAVAASVVTRWREQGAFDTRIAVYGSGRIADLAVEHARDQRNRVTVVGIFDDRNEPRRPGEVGRRIDGTLEDLVEVGRRELIDRIVIALPPAADRRMAEIARRLEQLPGSLHVCAYVAPDVVDGGKSHRVSTLGPLGLIDLKGKPLADWAPLIKNVEDRLLSACALLLLAPVLLAIAIAVKLDSKGPVLFRQRRRGLNHRTIQVLKFRSMRVMEDGATVTQARRNDPRVTRVGAFLRRTSLDELPQLINVLKGEMSLVGPRPHALVHDLQWGASLERYANRHQVKPGITGWAQVNGFRGEIDDTEQMRQRVEHDLHYIDNWSLGFDLQILWRTLEVTFGDAKAY